MGGSIAQCIIFCYFSCPQVPSTKHCKNYGFSNFLPQDAPREPRDAPSEPQDVPSEPHNGPIELQEAPSEQQDAPSEPQDAPTEPRDAASEPQYVLSERQDAPIEHQEAPRELHQTLGWRLAFLAPLFQKAELNVCVMRLLPLDLHCPLHDLHRCSRALLGNRGHGKQRWRKPRYIMYQC